MSKHPISPGLFAALAPLGVKGYVFDTSVLRGDIYVEIDSIRREGRHYIAKVGEHNLYVGRGAQPFIYIDKQINEGKVFGNPLQNWVVEEEVNDWLDGNVVDADRNDVDGVRIGDRPLVELIEELTVRLNSTVDLPDDTRSGLIVSALRLIGELNGNHYAEAFATLEVIEVLKRDLRQDIDRLAK